MEKVTLYLDVRALLDDFPDRMLLARTKESLLQCKFWGAISLAAGGRAPKAFYCALIVAAQSREELALLDETDPDEIGHHLGKLSPTTTSSAAMLLANRSRTLLQDFPTTLGEDMVILRDLGATMSAVEDTSEDKANRMTSGERIALTSMGDECMASPSLVDISTDSASLADESTCFSSSGDTRTASLSWTDTSTASTSLSDERTDSDVKNERRRLAIKYRMAVKRTLQDGHCHFSEIGRRFLASNI
eukprot:TRINITY_DN35788_c0_g1_i1.p1 TRINITY_DN35788_c0_g1~~TRINITY_DN35788_c0_g1_i1.p1  ORF type:complete len:280 (-),score=27.07 TRINITY_DN35788_c0_g1_i1:111-851(-)